MMTASASRWIGGLNSQRVNTLPESEAPFRVGTSGWSDPNWR